MICIKQILALAFIGSSFVAQTQTQEERAAPALITPTVNSSPLPKYDNDKLDYGMTIGIERTPKGRIWACWVGGGDNSNAFFVLATSDDNGNTWSKPRAVLDPHDKTLPEKRRTLVGSLWTDPKGRLWLFFDQSMAMFDGRAGTWYSICENPDAHQPTWSKPVRIWHGAALNKPVVLSNGDWLLVASLWYNGKKSAPVKDAFPELDSLRMANILASSDQGKTWTRRAGVLYKPSDLDESHIVEKKDGTLWLTSRMGKGLGESFSTDKGYTWSPSQESAIINVPSRHFMRRLKSGNLLLIKHGDKIDQRPRTRSQLAAFISDDDGKTWKGGLMLDERRGISYPDGFDAPDGYIYISYDRNRDTDGHILMARFTEKDILARKIVSKRSKLKMLISKPGVTEAPQPSDIAD